jgi:hypothetical protein
MKFKVSIVKFRKSRLSQNTVIKYHCKYGFHLLLLVLCETFLQYFIRVIIQKNNGLPLWIVCVVSLALALEEWNENLQLIVWKQMTYVKRVHAFFSEPNYLLQLVNNLHYVISLSHVPSCIKCCRCQLNILLHVERGAFY